MSALLSEPIEFEGIKTRLPFTDNALKVLKARYLIHNEEKDEYSLMTRLAIFADDKEQVMRLFRSSAQYRGEKPNAHYEKLADNAMAFVQKMRADMAAASINGASRSHIVANAK